VTGTACRPLFGVDWCLVCTYSTRIPSPDAFEVSLMIDQLPITDATWGRLVEANRRGCEDGWASPGVFGTGIGPEYGAGGLLYVGKSAGPLHGAVGSGCDQVASVSASTAWMIQRRNLSAFWQFADRIDQTRRSIAWTNVCKMDRIGGNTPPKMDEWAKVRDVSVAALSEEMETIDPKVTVFVISDTYRSDVGSMLAKLGYRDYHPQLAGDRWTKALALGEGRKYAVLTRHPQGWPNVFRDPVIEFVKSLL
jgi:hypothetical protein